MGLAVYRTGSTNVRVHATPDCRVLRAGQARQSSTKPIEEVDLALVTHPKLCKHCWPDAPMFAVEHTACDKCGFLKRKRPCRHNGGVLAVVPRPGEWVGRIGKGTYDRSSERYQLRWIWPENAHHYTLVSLGEPG